MGPLSESEIAAVKVTYPLLSREARRRVFHYSPYQVVMPLDQLVRELRAIHPDAARSLCRRILREAGAADQGMLA
jgi:hypothetical protein